jgi:hypothetical protein
MCVDCVLASLRIAQVDPGDEPLLEVVLSHQMDTSLKKAQHNKNHYVDNIWLW